MEKDFEEWEKMHLMQREIWQNMTFVEDNNVVYGNICLTTKRYKNGHIEEIALVEHKEFSHEEKEKYPSEDGWQVNPHVKNGPFIRFYPDGSIKEVGQYLCGIAHLNDHDHQDVYHYWKCKEACSRQYGIDGKVLNEENDEAWQKHCGQKVNIPTFQTLGRGIKEILKKERLLKKVEFALLPSSTPAKNSNNQGR